MLIRTSNLMICVTLIMIEKKKDKINATFIVQLDLDYGVVMLNNFSAKVAARCVANLCAWISKVIDCFCVRLNIVDSKYVIGCRLSWLRTGVRLRFLEAVRIIHVRGQIFTCPCAVGWQFVSVICMVQSN